MNTWKVLLATSVIFLTGFFAGLLFPRSPRIQWVPMGAPVSPPSSDPWGGLSGASSTDPASSTNPSSVNAPAPNERRIETLRKLLKDIELSPEQTQRIESHVQESRERTQLMWELIGPEVKEEFLRLRAEVVAVLTPEQKKQFEDRVKKYRRAERERNSRQNSTAPDSMVPGLPGGGLAPSTPPRPPSPPLVPHPPVPTIVAPPPVEKP